MCVRTCELEFFFLHLTNLDICLDFLVFPECTADKNFVFAVHNDFTNFPVNPMSLIVAGKTGCKPVISNKDLAIFKFSVSECGTRSYVSILPLSHAPKDDASITRTLLPPLSQNECENKLIMTWIISWT